MIKDNTPVEFEEVEELDASVQNELEESDPTDEEAAQAIEANVIGSQRLVKPK